MHWHGFDIPSPPWMASVASRKTISPRWPLRLPNSRCTKQEGFFYHSHMAMREMMGADQRSAASAGTYDPPVRPGLRHHPAGIRQCPIIPRPNSMNMEFNWLTLNGKSGPANTPLIIRNHSDRVRVPPDQDLGMDHHHRSIMHGHQFVITAAPKAVAPAKIHLGTNNTVLVGVPNPVPSEFLAGESRRLDDSCHAAPRSRVQMSSAAGPLHAAQWDGGRRRYGRRHGHAARRNATAEEYGPSLGRGMGASSSLAQPTTGSPLAAAA